MAESPDTPATGRADRASNAGRRRLAAGLGVVLVGVVVFVLVWFQPQKLWIDDRVDDAAPEGAVPLTIAPPPADTTVTAAPATTEVPDATTPTSDAPAPSGSTVPPPTATPVTTTTPTIPPTTAAPVPMTASFVSLDHGTSGTVVFLEDPATGDRYVRFEALDTSNGPDLKVYLSTNPVDGPESSFDDDFVDLGALQGNKGDQNYLLPPDVDLTRFASVVIWCDRFDSAFGAAKLTT